MTQKDLEAVIKKAKSDKIFLRRCFIDLRGAIREKGFNLTEKEMKKARSELESIYVKIVGKAVDKKTTAETAISTGTEQDRVIEITLNLLDNSVEDARRAFRNLRFLSNATFATGLLLFVVSAVSGLILQRETFSLVFGGLGTVAILAFFLTKPKEEIQTALSNLLQAEVIFLDFYDQLHFWAPYATEGDFEQRKKASLALNEATSFALQAFQQYIEPNKKKKN